MNAITVNGRTITEDAINVESAQHQQPGGDPREAQYQAAVALTVRELLRQRVEAVAGDLAEDLPFHPADADLAGDDGVLDQAIDALIEREVPVPEADEDACRTWYAQNPGQFRTPDWVEVRHILLAAPPEFLEEREAARETAEALIRDLQKDRDAFPRLARQYSRCPSKEQGGHLGGVSRGETVPEFEDAVVRLEVGLAERPIKTRYGFHVVEILQRIDGENLPYEEVRTWIARTLETRSKNRAVHQYLKLLAGQADVEGIELDGADSPLLQ